MEKEHVNILDCTLRDGGYYNNWRFDKKLIDQYLKNISPYVQYIEIGFRFLKNDNSLGDTAYSKPKFLNQIKKPKNIKFGVMLNASDIIFYGKNNMLKIIKKVFPKKDTKVDFVRIACHAFEIKKIIPVIKYLKKKYVVMVNVMQISEIKEKNINKICQILKNKIDCLYIADSLGSMSLVDMKKKIYLMKKYWKGSLGIHAHDNLKNALKNTLIATKNGFNWVDGTILGMGRGAGNTKTEDLIKILKKDNADNLKDFINKSFKNLKRKYNWGYNKYYRLAGKYKIHPTYIQTILRDNRYKKFDYQNIIKNLKLINSSRYNPDELMYSLFDKSKKFKNFNISKLTKCNYNKAIILGSSAKNNINKKIIEKKIIKNNYFVLALNTTKHIDEKFINFRISSHPLRLISEIENFKKIKSKIILPSGILPSKILVELNKKNIFFYNLMIQSNTFKVSRDYCILPNAISVAFAVCVILRIKIHNVELFGFDLRKNSNDNTLDILDKIAKNFKYVKLKYSKKFNFI